MLRFWTFLLMMTIASTTIGQTMSLEKVRENYFKMDKTGCKALEMSDSFQNKPPTSPLLLAYYGALTAAAPECIVNPLQKLNYFKRGKQLLNQAVTLQPKAFEIRFLRFATQSKAPSFLGYNDYIGVDKAFLLNNLTFGKKEIANDSVFFAIINFILASDELKSDERKQLEAISLQLK